MLNKENVLALIREQGKQDATSLQNNAESMTGTQLYESKDLIPSFAASVVKKNMLEREVGFVCRSTAGRIVRLLQKYDSATYPQEPEELPAQWGFKWSTNPNEALPFIALSTSPYNTNDCCTEEGVVYRSKIDNNVWKPSEYSQGWEVVE